MSVIKWGIGITAVVAIALASALVLKSGNSSVKNLNLANSPTVTPVERPVLTAKSSSTVSGETGPFGLRMGMTTDEILDTGAKLQPIDIAVYDLENPAIPSEIFGSYAVSTTPKNGLCKIIAYTKIFYADGYGTEIKNKYAEIKQILDKKYGNSKNVEILDPKSTRKEKNEWMRALSEGEITMSSTWSEKSGSKLKSNLESITLMPSPQSSISGYIGVYYDFSNIDACLEEMKELKKKKEETKKDGL
jgi:hypothetical protein